VSEQGLIRETIDTPNLSQAKSARVRSWWAMIVVSMSIIPANFFYKLYFHEPVIQYGHLLVTYHFGFAKRAFIGAVVSLFTDTVPVVLVYLLGLAVWLIALCLFILAFKKIFGFQEENLPLLVFMGCSPFFFKNFMFSIGYFDIYGCILALAALIVPVGASYQVLLAAGCVILILIHPLHLLLYCPVIAFIAFVRYRCAGGFSPMLLASAGIVASVVCVVFVASVFFGQMRVSPETWLAYMQSRATVPVDPHSTYLWYSTISEEISRTWNSMFNNALRFPVYAILIALHLPLIRAFKALIRALVSRSDRTVVVVTIGMICVFYLIIGAILFDYSRWVSNWAVCMFLAMLATRLLPSTLETSAGLIDADLQQNRKLGWILALIPRVGVTKPF
jgi:hypothetical protein